MHRVISTTLCIPSGGKVQSDIPELCCDVANHLRISRPTRLRFRRRRRWHSIDPGRGERSPLVAALTRGVQPFRSHQFVAPTLCSCVLFNPRSSSLTFGQILPCATPSNLRGLLQPHSSAFSVLRCLVPTNRNSRNFGHSMCDILAFCAFFGLVVLQCSAVWTGRI